MIVLDARNCCEIGCELEGSGFSEGCYSQRFPRGQGGGVVGASGKEGSVTGASGKDGSVTGPRAGLLTFVLLLFRCLWNWF